MEMTLGVEGDTSAASRLWQAGAGAGAGLASSASSSEDDSEPPPLLPASLRMRAGDGEDSLRLGARRAEAHCRDPGPDPDHTSFVSQAESPIFHGIRKH
jgi:hypothetical protein